MNLCSYGYVVASIFIVTPYNQYLYDSENLTSDCRYLPR